jgi:hypothetical protein
MALGVSMKMTWGADEFWSERFENRRDGCEGFRLHRKSFRKVSIAAEAVYWDANGSFSFRTIDGDLPFEVVQAAMEEAKREIKTK